MSALGRAVTVLSLGASLLTLGAPALADGEPAADPPAAGAVAPAASPGTPLVLRPSHPPSASMLVPEAQGGTSLKLVAGVAIAAGGLLLWSRRKRRTGPAPKERSLRIAARKAIGVRSELLVVEVEGQTLLLGVTPGSIQRLAVLSDPLEESELVEDGERAFLEPGFSSPPSSTKASIAKASTSSRAATLAELRAVQARSAARPAPPQKDGVHLDALPARAEGRAPEAQIRGLLRSNRTP